MYFFAVTILLGIIRAILATYFDLNPFQTNIWYLFPDILFVLSTTYWLLRIEKAKINIYVFFYLISFLGSIVWDYQYGYLLLKLTFPFVLFLIINRDKFSVTTLSEFVKFFLPLALFPPFFLITQYKNLKDGISKDNKSTDIKDVRFGKPIFIGIFIGLATLFLLVNLDPAFGRFLRFENWIDFVINTIWANAFYMFSFIFFFVIPIKTKWEPEIRYPVLEWIIQGVIVMVLTIIVAYSLYDLYIILRALKLVDLKYESMGKNTQMQYLELVILGGMWLFASTYLIAKAGVHMLDKNNLKIKISKYINALIASLFLLLPPVLNIFRVLLFVYIPQFGLTARRLFGVYTAVAFIMAFVVVAYYFLKKDKTKTFTTSILTFWLVIYLFSFLVPNNILTAKWHIDKYIATGDADFSYVQDIKLEKWASMFNGYFDTNKYKSDVYWKYYLSLTSHDKKSTDFLRSQIINNVTNEVSQKYPCMVANSRMLDGNVYPKNVLYIADVTSCAMDYQPNLRFNSSRKLDNYITE